MSNETACECITISRRVTAQCEPCASEKFRKATADAASNARLVSQNLNRLVNEFRSR